MNQDQNLHRITLPRLQPASGWIIIIVTLVLWTMLSLTAQAAAPPVTLQTVRTGDRFGIQWDAIPDAIYKVQSSTTLGSAVSWVTEEPVSTNNIGPIRWMAPESMAVTKFYRVVLPQPEIFSIEPSVLGTNGGTVYVVGQLLGTNGALRLGPAGGVEQAGSGDGHIMMVTLPPLAEGTYDVSWLIGGQVVASAAKLFSVTAEVQPAGIAQRLLEPPEEWPAAPRITLKQKVTEDPVGAMRDYEREPAHVEVPNLRLFSGEVQLCVADLFVPGTGMDFVWGRTYRSRTGTNNTTMGNGWDHSYNLWVQPLGGDILVHGGTGRDDRFYRQTNGTYAAPGFFNEGTLSNNVFRLAFADTGFWEFNPLDSSPPAGKISRIVDCHNNALTFGYDGLGRLATIVDTLNRTNVVAYNSAGRVQSVTDFAGRTFSYAYYSAADAGGSDGDLAAAISPPIVGTPNGNDFPGGKTNRYTYSKGYLEDRENHLLLRVIDPKGQAAYDHVYQHNQTDLEFIRCRSVQYGTNTPVNFHLVRETPAPSNHFAVCRVIVNDALGNVSECYFDSRNRLLTLREFTGRAVPGVTTTESANRPTGKLRSTDPDYFESQWSWTSDSLCAMYVNPRTIARQKIFESDLDSSSNARKRGDLRIVRELATAGGADTDGDGIPDLTTRSWYFSYDPRFGSPDVQSWRGWDGTIKGNRGGIREKGDDVGMRLSSAQQVNKVTVRGWDPKKKEAIVGEASGGKLRRRGYSAGHFALDMCGNIDPSGAGPSAFLSRVICPTEDSGASKPPRLVIDPLGNTFTCVLDGNGDCVHTETTERKSGAVIACDYNYKEHSRLAAVTNSPDGNGYRRVDTFSYYTNGPQNGYLREWQVDATGPVVTITAYEYDAVGDVTRMIDPRSNDWLFVRNAAGQCVRFQGPTNLTARPLTDCFYDANDNMIQCVTDVRDENDNKIGTMLGLKAYDELNRCVTHCTQVSSKHFVTNRFDYDANGNCVTIYSPEAVNGNDPNNLVAFQFDERDLLFREIRAPGTADCSTNEYSYSASKYTLERKKLKSGVSVSVDRFTYDGFDRSDTATDPMGNVTVRAHDALDNLVYQRFDGETNDVPGSASNRRLTETRYDYDSLCRLTRVHDAFFDPATGQLLSDGESTTSCTYAPNDACLSLTDDNGHTTRFTYDTIGRLASRTDPKTNTVSYTYDPCGNVLTVDSLERSDLGAAQEFSCTFVYDSLGRRTRSTDNVNNRTQYAYDSLGNGVRSIDARGHVTGATYDYLGRCTVAIADLDQDGLLDYAADAGHSFVWNDNSQLVATTDDNTNTTAYMYDSLNRWTIVQRPDGSHARCSYDQHDNVITNVDANGTVVAFTYDLNDRCVRKDITPAGGATSTTTFENFAYDGCSRCILAGNDVSTVSFAYDSLGNCVRSTQDGLTAASSFDGVGACLSMTYPAGRVVTYAYDPLDQPTSITTPLANGRPPSVLASLAYEGPGRIGRVTRANNVSTRMTWNGLLSPPNASGDFGWRQVSGINHQVAGGGATIDRRGFVYDQNQNKTLRAQLAPFFQGAPLGTNQFIYDALDRLRTAINTKGASAQRNDYVLDGNGNRQAVTNNGTVQLYSMDSAMPPGDFQVDQYSTTPFAAQQYDDNGNLVSRASAAGFLQYRYDYASRLVEVDGFATGAASPIVSFTYDALGRRISKTVYPPAPALPVTTQFVYDGGDMDRDGILEERVAGAVARVFVWDSVKDLPSGKSVPLAAFDSSGQPQYYHCDDLGNALALTDSIGHILERYDYDDYGLPAFLSSDGVVLVDGGGQPVTASPQGNPFLFHGMFWDSETFLYVEAQPGDEDPASYFDPEAGRRGSSSRSPDSLVFNVVNPRAARSRRPGRCAWGYITGRSAFTFCGDNPWSAPAIYTEWAAGPRHYDDVDRLITDCDDHDPKRHRPTSTCRTEFAILRQRFEVCDSGASRSKLKTFFETGDIPTESQFERGDKPTQAQFGTLIDSMINRLDDRNLLGLREYDPAKQYLIGDTAIYNSGIYNARPRPKSFLRGEITGHVTLIK